MAATTKAYIVYYRVSTQKQGRSGLGLEAQKAAVLQYLRIRGGLIRAEYTEVETGKRADRPELLKAIAHARRSKATLIVAKLDRLARNAAFLLTLRDSGLPLVFCDLPDANELTIGIMAVVAQAEAKATSERTKVALAAYKARGGKLGSRDPRCRSLSPAAWAKGQAAGTKAVKEMAREAYRDLVPLMQKLREEGLSLKAVAQQLNIQGHTTRGDKPWNAVQVKRVLDRAAGSSQ